MRRPTATMLRLIALVVLVAGAAIIVGRLGPSIDEVATRVDAAGAVGPLVFVAIYAGLTVALVPGTASTLASGVLFGPVRGTVLAICGATLGATIAFGLGRALGRDGVRRIVGARAPRLEAAVDGTGFVAMLVLRLLPVVPFNGLNYAAGATGIRARSYVAATVLGIAPGTTAIATAGGSIDDPGSPAFIGSAAVGGVLLVASLVVAARRRRRDAGDEADG